MHRILFLLTLSHCLAINLYAGPKRKLNASTPEVKRMLYQCKQCNEGPFNRLQLNEHQCPLSEESELSDDSDFSLEEREDSDDFSINSDEAGEDDSIKETEYQDTEIKAGFSDIEHQNSEHFDDREKCPEQDCNCLILQSSLERHLLFKHYICTKGHNIRFSSPLKLYNHYKNFHSNANLFLCNKCNTYLNRSKKLLISHQKKCGIIKGYSCTECEVSCDTLQAISDHLIKIHHICHMCCPKTQWRPDPNATKIKQLESLAQHLIAFHKRTSIYICYNLVHGEPCGNIACNKQSAKKHHKVHKNGIPLERVKPDKAEIECPHCDRINFKTISAARNHIISVHLSCPLEKKLSCSKWHDESSYAKKGVIDPVLEKKRRELYEHLKERHNYKAIYISPCNCLISPNQNAIKNHSCRKNPTSNSDKGPSKKRKK